MTRSAKVFASLLFALLCVASKPAFSDSEQKLQVAQRPKSTEATSSSASSDQGNRGEASFFRLEQEVITSASKYAQNIVQSPSAISVISKEDIRQSGTLDITELFRFTPGTMVVDLDSLGREVIVRGFPQEFSPRLLVLMDGVPLYTPLFSGVTWNFLPFSLPDIERIEVIRGASSTLYGANAFSGVINIITKKVDTQRNIQFYQAIGNLQLQQSELIYNQPINDKVRFRVSGLFRHDNGFGAQDGDSQNDAQIGGHGMLDLEADPSNKTHIHTYAYVKGADRKEVFTGFIGPQSPSFINFIGGTRMDHKITDKQDLTFQATFQDLHQKDYNPPTLGTQTRREFDADLLYTNHFTDRDTLVSGASFRTGGYSFLNFLPPGLQHLTLASFFANNDFKILDNLIVTTGGRYEFDSFTHNQLSGRFNLTYSPFKDQAFRWSVARAVRTPSVIEERLSLNGLSGLAPPPLPPQTLVSASGNPNLSPESVIAGEFGYHGSFLKNKVNADFQFYYNQVDSLITLGLAGTNLGAVPPQASFSFANRGNGQVWGIESEIGWQVFDWWKTSLNYTLTRQNGFVTGRFPDNLLSFKNRFAFNNGFSTELLFNYTSPYTFFDTFTATAFPVGNIFRLDARIAQRLLHDKFEIAIVGQNLVDSPHIESNPAVRVDRLVYGTFSIRY